MAQSRLSKPGWKVLGVIALGGVLWFGVPRLLSGLDFFEIRKIEVRGQRQLRAEEIVAALELRQGVSIFGSLDSVNRRGDSIPGLESFRVHRRLPGTLVVTVREIEPIALVMRQGKLQLLSERGRVLPFDPRVAAPDLPLAREADSLVTGLLARVRDADATLFARVITASRAGDDVLLTVEPAAESGVRRGGRRQFRFRPDAPAGVIKAVTQVEQDLVKRGRQWAELDARFAGQVVVRWEAV